jgi:hypothetical protein
LDTNSGSTAFTVRTRTIAGVDGACVFAGTNSDTSITLTNSDAYYTVTRTLPATFGSLSVEFVLGSHVSGDGFEITGVQLEIGDTATPFEHRSYADQLQTCQRYYQKLGGSNYTRFFSGFCGTTTAANCVYVFSCEMRAAPTAGSSGTFAVYHSSNVVSTTSSLGVSDQTATSMAVSGNTSGLTVGGGALIIANNDSSAKFTLDAEL